MECPLRLAAVCHSGPLSLRRGVRSNLGPASSHRLDQSHSCFRCQITLQHTANHSLAAAVLAFVLLHRAPARSLGPQFYKPHLVAGRCSALTPQWMMIYCMQAAVPTVGLVNVTTASERPGTLSHLCSYVSDTLRAFEPSCASLQLSILLVPSSLFTSP